MIDFRYHLVSLISVFLALAVGIVLGAGPLQQPIGDSLQSQVEALRTDRDSLRTEVDEARATIDELNEYVTASAPDLLADSLSGESVALVSAPGADADAAASLEERVTQAGAEVAVQLSLAETALDPEGAGELLETLQGIDPTLPEGGAEALTAALARALTAGATEAEAPGDEAQAGSETAPTGEPTEAGTPAGPTTYTADQAAEVIAAFSGDGRLTGGEYAPATAIVLIAPVAAETDAAAQATESTAPPQGEAGTAEAALAAALAQDAPTVVAGSLDSAERGLLAALRSDDSGITTADGFELTAGPIITTLAVEQALTGEPGAFGFADSAQAVIPGAEG